ncbi:hypothetical protein L596_004388 [Steinernema carpocapsae]|uniref:Uncharacterized protein n=1 Tax=Steinernema carpocapsae TaxID=34508 RepID=A0A4U8UVN2_STECR|nr:hypothetical protein L596_004388 [Steinernema carpocapsae]
MYSMQRGIGTRVKSISEQKHFARVISSVGKSPLQHPLCSPARSPYRYHLAVSVDRQQNQFLFSVSRFAAASEMPACVVITGANRGIGFGLVREILKCDDVKHVFACCRNPEGAERLHKLRRKDDRVNLVQMDVTKPESIAVAAAQVTELVGSTGVNLLINNAGTLADSRIEDALGPQTILGANQDCYLEIFNVNVVGAILVTKEFMPLLVIASQAYPDQDAYTINRSAIINISSGLASIGSNIVGSGYFNNMAYRCSKTALNQFTKTASIDFKPAKILVVSCCPGWVKTDMGGLKASLEVSESARCLCRNLQRFGEKENGGFFKLDGERELF